MRWHREPCMSQDDCIGYKALLSKSVQNGSHQASQPSTFVVGTLRPQYQVGLETRSLGPPVAKLLPALPGWLRRKHGRQHA